MGSRQWVVSLGLLLTLCLSAAHLVPPAWSSTIQAGERRVAAGQLAAVDLGYRTVVIEVPRSGDSLTVGVTLAPEAEITRGGRSVPLDRIAVGTAVVLEYTRQGDRLIGLRLRQP